MFRLVLKDLVVQKREKTYLVVLIFGIINALGSQANPLYSIGLLIMGTYLFVVYANAFDYKYNGEMLVNSLPVTRAQVVVAKYLAALVFLGITLAISITPGLILKLAGVLGSQPFFNTKLIVPAIFTVGVYFSIYFPLYFKFGYMKSRWANWFAIMVPMVLITLLGILEREGASGSPPIRIAQAVEAKLLGGINGILLLLLGLIMIGSLLTSVRIYEKREF